VRSFETHSEEETIALGRKLAETQSQQNLLGALAETFGLGKAPRRIEVYDNSHIQGANAVGAMIVAGPEGFRKNQYRKFNIRSESLTPGDDFGMMREVLTRRFKRLLSEAPRETGASFPSPRRGEGAEPRSGVGSPDTRKYRLSHPSRVAFTPGVAVSM